MTKSQSFICSISPSITPVEATGNICKEGRGGSLWMDCHCVDIRSIFWCFEYVIPALLSLAQKSGSCCSCKTLYLSPAVETIEIGSWRSPKASIDMFKNNDTRKSTKYFIPCVIQFLSHVFNGIVTNVRLTFTFCYWVNTRNRWNIYHRKRMFCSRDYLGRNFHMWIIWHYVPHSDRTSEKDNVIDFPQLWLLLTSRHSWTIYLVFYSWYFQW